MGSRQSAHRPRRISQPSTGTLCHARIGVSQRGQWDGGVTTDAPTGTRWITTLRNDPIARPRRPDRRSRRTTELLRTDGQERHCNAAGPARPGDARVLTVSINRRSTVPVRRAAPGRPPAPCGDVTTTSPHRAGELLPDDLVAGEHP